MMLRSVLRMLRTPFLMLRTHFSCCEHFFNVANTFSHVANTFSPCCEHFFHVAPPPSSPDIVYMLRVMLRVCGEHVASLWRACCDQHPNIVLRTLFPYCEQLFPCCEHFFQVSPPPSSPNIVYILRAMLRACGEHVAITIQISDAKLVGAWEGVRLFSPSDV
jgi:hypothetical protein